MKVEGFSDVGRGEKSGFKRDNKFPHKKARHEGEWNRGQDTSKGEKPKQFQGSGFKPKGNFVKKGAPFKGSQPKGDASGKPRGACFNCNEVGHYSKDCPKLKLGNGASKVIAFTSNLGEGECNRLIFLKGKLFKREVLCLLDTGASHNFITQESAERMGLPLEELKCRNPSFGLATKAKGVARLRAKRKEARESRQRHSKSAGQEEARELRQEEARESHHIFPGV
jgi:hypothetical protein